MVVACDGGGVSEIINSLVLRKNENINSIILKPRHKFFNYFNRISISNKKITLYCQRHKNANSVIYPEIEMLVYKLIKLFGVDTHNKCFYNLEKERDIDSEFIRQWSFKDIKI